MLPVSTHQRLQDLEDHVAQDLKLLKQYEDKIRLTDDPKQAVRYQREVEQLRVSAQRYQQEAEQLQAQLNHELLMQQHHLEQEKQATRSQLNQIAVGVQALMGGQAILLGELHTTRQILLNHYDDTQQDLMRAIAEQLDLNQLLVTQQFLEAIDRDRVSQDQMQQLWEVLENQIPALSPQHPQVLEILKSPQLDVKNKLKLSLPIIPFLVDLESELELGSGFDLKLAWDSLLRIVRSKSEPVPNHKPIWQVAQDIRQQLTEEDRNWIPQDGAANHDYYIYGTPEAKS